MPTDSSQYAISDQNRVDALLLHSGTANDAETIRATGQSSGAQNTHITGGTVTTTSSGGTAVNIVSGTQQTLGTVGVLNSGTVTITNPTGTVVQVVGTVPVEQRYTYFHATEPGTTTLKSGAAILHAFVINSKSVGGIGTVFDSTTATGTVIAAIDTTLSTTAFTYDVTAINGLTFAWAGNTGGDVTIAYR